MSYTEQHSTNSGTGGGLVGLAVLVVIVFAIVYLVGLMLRKDGYQILTAVSAAEGFDLARPSSGRGQRPRPDAETHVKQMETFPQRERGAVR